MYGVHDQIVKELGVAFPADLLALTLPHLAEPADLQRSSSSPGGSASTTS